MHKQITCPMGRITQSVLALVLSCVFLTMAIIAAPSAQAAQTENNITFAYTAEPDTPAASTLPQSGAQSDAQSDLQTDASPPDTAGKIQVPYHAVGTGDTTGTGLLTAGILLGISSFILAAAVLIKRQNAQRHFFKT